jgi:RNA polymerase sigma-70 factor (ECF subfamily)
MALPELDGSRDPDGSRFAETVERARRGDLAAFERLILAHERKVLRTAQALLGNREDARDAAQETFLRVFRYLDRFDARREFAPWLYRLVVNVCRDIQRKRGVAGVDLSGVPQELLAERGEQESRVDAADRDRMVRSALAVLTEKEREALVLRDIEGLPTAEVARVLGCMEVTVRSHVSRARLKLRSALAALQGECP